MVLSPSAHSSIAPSIVFCSFAALVFVKHFRKDFQSPTSAEPLLLTDWGIIGLVAAILLVTAWSASLPPHLAPEYDALNYHYSLPRQHLIQGSFRHLPWSSADLWLLPIQFALAPYWFCTPLPNKVPQFLFLLGLLAVLWSLGHTFGLKRRSRLMLVASVIGSHGFMIQFGTAMIDLVIAYLGCAALDSALAEDWGLSAIEFSFFLWSKSFMPIQLGVIAVTLSLLVLVFRRSGFTFVWIFNDRHLSIEKRTVRRALVATLLLSFVVGGPFIAKSLFYAGTPLYPFAPFSLNGRLATSASSKSAVIEAARLQRETRNAYGEGRTIQAWLAHFWRVAVPDEGVNNRFDYPLGLPYLLFLGPFLWGLFEATRSRQFPVLSWAAVALWATWWGGSQQARWLYVPLLLIFVSALSLPWIAENRILRLGIVISLALSALSVIRATLPDLRDRQGWVRPQDKRLQELCGDWKGDAPITVPTKEVAFATVPVSVESSDPYWVFVKS